MQDTLRIIGAHHPFEPLDSSDDIPVIRRSWLARVSPDARAVASRGLTLKPETVAVTSTCTDPNRCRRAA